MLDLIRHFLFFNPSQRWSADSALRHVFFSEVDEEPVHHASIEPITPPDKYAAAPPSCSKPITPLDLLSTPQSPYQICPDWNTDRPVSRIGRLCSAIKDSPETTTDTSMWLNQSRPIYSSHQKIHPVSDRPNSSHLWNKYNYAAHQRPSTPVVDHSVAVGLGHHHHGVHNNGPSSSSNTSKRYSDDFMGDTHRRLGHHHLHDQQHSHHPNHIKPPPVASAAFHMDRLPHYGSQLVKWAPPRYTAKPAVVTTGLHYHQPSIVPDTELSRPESRRCRSPAPFSSQLMKHKYTTTSNTGLCTGTTSSGTIKSWTPPAPAPAAVVTQEKINTHRNSTSHRFNLWVPDTEEDEEVGEPFDRSVFLSMP